MLTFLYTHIQLGGFFWCIVVDFERQGSLIEIQEV